MPEHHRIAIVPARNEEAAVARRRRGAARLRSRARRRRDRRRLRGRDGRASRAAAGAAVVSLPFNLGIGGAVQTGFKYALEHGYDTVDPARRRRPARPAADPERCSAPLERGEADVVVGSRFAEGAGDYRAPFARRAGIRWFAQLVSLLTRQKLTDTTSGFQAVNARAIRLFAADYPHDYPEVEAAVMVVRHELRILEVPAQMRGRETGRSSITLLRSLYYAIKVTLALLVGIFRRRVVPLEESEMDPVTPLYVSIAASVASILLILVVFELIRSRRLRERYALLWLATGVVLLVLSAWRGGLNTIAGWVGVTGYPPAVLFAVGDALHPRRAAALLDRDLEARRPERDPGAAARAARAARPARARAQV